MVLQHLKLWCLHCRFCQTGPKAGLFYVSTHAAEVALDPWAVNLCDLVVAFMFESWTPKVAMKLGLRCSLGQPSGSPGTPSVTTRMNRMIKIFENQTTMLEKALSDHHTIESKYKQMEIDYQMLILEKTLLEGEIRRLREIERVKSATREERTKKTGKSGKRKFKENEKNLSPNRDFKSFEELLQIQEAERNKTQLEFVLRRKMEMFKEESKTKLDRGQSQSKLKVEDSKDSLPKKSDTQLSGQRKDQISPDQSKRSVGER
ncbi:coiled-coil domain-containing protein 7 [Mus pahari]|uniref:coiled-coil domain-containing protein 7 n=1 Tax=Mus pahari TaxID=10093 RepID=UPI000A31179F|nr:coiled-coil domain-containing protein 7 [Mus pahari]